MRSFGSVYVCVCVCVRVGLCVSVCARVCRVCACACGGNYGLMMLVALPGHQTQNANPTPTRPPILFQGGCQFTYCKFTSLFTDLTQIALFQNQPKQIEKALVYRTAIPVICMSESAGYTVQNNRRVLKMKSLDREEAVVSLF